MSQAEGGGAPKWLLLAPLVVFFLIGALFAVQLFTKDDDLPSALIDRPAPEFDMPTLAAALSGAPSGGARVKTADLAGDKVVVVNFWASWCGPCRVEHPALMALQKLGVARVVGVAYRDQPDASKKFLEELGDPFDAIASDLEGRVGLSWGLAGVPETFILTKDGRVAYKHVGPIQNDDLEAKILPAIEAAGRL